MPLNKRIKPSPKAFSVWLEVLLHAGTIDACRAPDMLHESIDKLHRSGLLRTGERIGGPPPGSALKTWSIPKDPHAKTMLNLLWQRVRKDPDFDIDLLLRPMRNHDSAPSADYIETHHNELLSLGEALPLKARALFTVGDTHECDSSKRIGVSMNSKGRPSTWSKNGKSFTLEQGSDVGMMQQFVVENAKDDDWTYEGTIAVVENADLALYPDLYLERVAYEGPVLHFHGGTLSKKAMNWLADPRRGNKILMMVDYDVSGLLAYLKTRERLGDKVQLYVPDNLPQLFERYGSKTLFRNQLSLDVSPILKTDNLAVRGVFSLIRKFKCSLEQEALIQSYDANYVDQDDSAPSWVEVERRAGQMDENPEEAPHLSVVNAV